MDWAQQTALHIEELEGTGKAGLTKVDILNPYLWIKLRRAASRTDGDQVGHQQRRVHQGERD